MLVIELIHANKNHPLGWSAHIIRDSEYKGNDYRKQHRPDTKFFVILTSFFAGRAHKRD